MYLVYSLLLTLGFIALLPRLAIDAMRSGKYVTGLRQRLGRLPLVNPTGKPLIWLHCVSVGETRAAQSLVRSLSDRFPSHLLVLSTTTVTGQQLARKLFGQEAALVFYFPLDLAWVVRRVLRNLNPSAVLIMETELWPRLMRECRIREIPVALINGRISNKSFKRYAIIRSFMRSALGDLTIALMQSDRDAARIRDLGLPQERISLPGNLKFDTAGAATDEALTEDLRERFAFDDTRPLIVAASTHSPEEQILINAFKEVRRSRPDARLLIAPRHPERFNEVASLLELSNLTWARKSAPVRAEDSECDAVLLDTIGELRALYPLANLVFVGGSIAPHGGHNVLEPAAVGCCVLTGPHTGNFAAVITTMLAEGGLIQLAETSAAGAASELATTITKLLSDDTKRRDIGERARAVCQQNAGATGRTISMLVPILSSRVLAGDCEPVLSTLHATTAK